jgi:hypothetical protein
MIASNAAKRYILQGDNLAPNAPSTIKAKGSSRPLVDTSQLVKSITWVVRQGESTNKEDRSSTKEASVDSKIEKTVESDFGEAVTLGGEAAEVAIL